MRSYSASELSPDGVARNPCIVGTEAFELKLFGAEPCSERALARSISAINSRGFGREAFIGAARLGATPNDCEGALFCESRRPNGEGVWYCSDGGSWSCRAN